MSWSNFSASKRDLVRDLASMVLETVTHFRNRGHCAEHAIEQTALALDLTPRRVKSLVYGEAFSAQPDERHRVHALFLRQLDAEALDLARRSDAARARRRQMELDL